MRGVVGGWAASGAVLVAGAAAGVMVTGCDLVAGIGEYCEVGVDPGCGTTGSGATGGTAGTGGTGAGTSTGGTGGTTTTGGTGGTGGAGVCMPGETKSCYGGPDMTAGVGICKAGKVTCNESGSGFGACVGEQTPKTETCAATDDEDCNGVDCVLWAKIAASPGQQFPRTMTLDQAGNIFVLGNYEQGLVLDDVTLDSVGASDLFLAKFEPGGKALWATRVGSEMVSGNTRADLAVDALGNATVVSSFGGTLPLGGAILTATGTKDAYLVKVDSSGVLGVVKQFGLLGTTVADHVTLDPSGNTFFSGSFDGEVNFGLGKLTNAGSSDGYIAKLSAAGETQWVHVFEKPTTSTVDFLGADKNGDVTIGGSFIGSLDFGGGPLPSADSHPDLFVARFGGTAGSYVWSNSFAASGGAGVTVRVRQFAVDAAAGVYLAGEFSAYLNWAGTDVGANGGTDVYLARLDANGNYLWDQHYGTGSGDLFRGFAVDPSGNVKIMVSAPGGVDLGNGPLFAPDSMGWFLASIDPAGVTTWSRRITESYGGAGSEGCGLAMDDMGAVVGACGYVGDLNLGIGGMSSDADGSSDVLTFRLAP